MSQQGLQEGDLEMVWRSNSTLVVCFCPSWRFDVVLHSGSPHAVPTVMKVGLPRLARVHVSLCPRQKKKKQRSVIWNRGRYKCSTERDMRRRSWTAWRFSCLLASAIGIYLVGSLIFSETSSFTSLQTWEITKVTCTAQSPRLRCQRINRYKTYRKLLIQTSEKCFRSEHTFACQVVFLSAAARPYTTLWWHETFLSRFPQKLWSQLSLKICLLRVVEPQNLKWTLEKIWKDAAVWFYSVVARKWLA